MLTIKQLCEKYPYLSQSLVYLWVEQEQLPHYRLGGKERRGRILIDEADFVIFLRSCKVEGRTEPAARRSRFKHLT